MKAINTTRKGFLTMATSLAAMLVGCGAQTGQDEQQSAAQSASGNSSSSAGGLQTFSNSDNGGHALAVSGESASYKAIDVTKTGDDDGDEADFYGTNAAVYAEEGATLDLDDIQVTTDGVHANAVFSYGEGTTVTIKNSTIDTSNNTSGAIMVTGGGKLVATDITAHTLGNSSAPIRSDRGGGVQQVSGGTFTSEGVGSPVIYSTATVEVSGATLESKASQGVVVEGKNSVSLKDCTLVANNTQKNGDKSDTYQAVMIYQSMSGDAAQGAASFAAEGGTITNKHGDVFFVNNTVCTISLKNSSITNEDAEGVFLRAEAAGWGSEGSNGGQVTMEAEGQQIDGEMVVDEVSNLNLYLKSGSTFAGCINKAGAAGKVFVSVEEGNAWELTADSNISSLTCSADAIKLSGHKLMVDGKEYEEGSASTGEPIEVVVTESTGGPGGGEPPQKPGGEGGMGEPPEKPDDGGEPPAKPDGAPGAPSSSSNSSSSSSTSSSK